MSGRVGKWTAVDEAALKTSYYAQWSALGFHPTQKNAVEAYRAYCTEHNIPLANVADSTLKQKISAQKEMIDNQKNMAASMLGLPTGAQATPVQPATRPTPVQPAAAAAARAANGVRTIARHALVAMGVMSPTDEQITGVERELLHLLN